MVNNKIPTEIEEKILKEIEEGYIIENHMYNILDIKQAISLAFKEGRTQTLEKVKEKIENRYNELKEKLNIEERRRKEKQMNLDFSGEWEIERIIAKMLELKEILSQLEDDEVGEW